MELVHDFTVPVPVEETWKLLVDVQKIAPCLPGAAVTSVDGDAFEGGMKIKVGPIGMTFKGGGRFVELDEAGRRAVLEAQGRDAKGNGGAQATVTVTLQERGDVTDAHLVTDFNISGKAAQFGSGVVKDISNKMLSQFATNLSQMIESGGAGEEVRQAAATGDGAAAAGASTSTASASTASGPTSPTPSQPFSPSDDGGIDAVSLLLGSESFRATATPVLALVGGALIGYLYGKNRTLERMLRRA